MIELITGLPGNAKTLYVISMVKARSEAENRPVYYSGIKFNKDIGWTQIDPTKWMECPAGSLIVIDECQKIFRARSLGSTPPLHVTELEEHRHRGHDLVLMSQHPSLVDPSVRRLSGVHKHMVRIFGMEASTVHRWASVKDNCDKNSARADSEKTRWAFDKSLYGVYHSADEHTMKRHIPMRLKLLLLVPFVLAAAAYYVYKVVRKPPAVPPPIMAPGVPRTFAPGVVGPAVPIGTVMPANMTGLQPLQVFDPLADAKDFTAKNTPRIVGLPHTAPKYDELTKPTRVPVPSMCIQSKDACKCFTQQGTAMAIEASMCVSFARNGFFQEFDPDRDHRESARTEAGRAVMASRPDVPLSSSSVQVMQVAGAGRYGVGGG